MWGQLSTTCSNVLKQPNGELLVAVNHKQLRTMASETVDPIDWSHPPRSWAVPPERHVRSVNQCNLDGTRTCNRSMRGNHLAYAATQGEIALKQLIPQDTIQNYVYCDSKLSLYRVISALASIAVEPFSREVKESSFFS